MFLKWAFHGYWSDRILTIKLISTNKVINACFFQLSFDLLESWLASNPDALRMKSSNGESAFRDLALFQDYHGSADFKNVTFYNSELIIVSYVV